VRHDFGHILNQPDLREIELHRRTVLRFFLHTHPRTDEAARSLTGWMPL
jgi:hypothetical protein